MLTCVRYRHCFSPAVCVLRFSIYL